MSISALASLLVPDSELASSRCPDLDEAPGEALSKVGAADAHGGMGDLPPEFARLFYAVEALRAGDRPVVLQFAGAAGAAGATTVASGFARAAAAGHSRPVLFLDGRLDAAPGPQVGLIEACRQGRPLAAAVAAVEGVPNLRWGRLARQGVGAAGRDAADIRALLDLARRDHPVTVLDSPGLGASPVSAALSRFCDGTVLVVQAGRTKAAAVRAARAEVERFGGQVVGAVLNRHREAAPHWLARLA